MFVVLESYSVFFMSGSHCYCPVWLWVLEPCRGGCTTFMAGLLDPDTEVAEPPYQGSRKSEIRAANSSI